MPNYPRLLGTEEIRYIAFEGGGGKGNAFIGALESLGHSSLDVIRNSGYRLTNIQGVAGASAGAITALFVAAGFAPLEVKAISELEDFNEFFDAPNPGRVFRIGGFEDHPTSNAVNTVLIALVAEALALFRDMDVIAMASYVARRVPHRDLIRMLEDVRDRVQGFRDVSDPIAVAAAIAALINNLTRLGLDDLRGALAAIQTLFRAVPPAIWAHLVELSIGYRALVRLHIDEAYITPIIANLNFFVRLLRQHLDDATFQAILNRDVEATAQALVQDFGILTGEAIYNFFRRWLAVARMRINNASQYQAYLSAAGGDIPRCFAALKDAVVSRSDSTLAQYYDDDMTFEAFERDFQIKFAVTGSNLETMTSQIFSGATTPRFYVVDAVRLSMSLPYGVFFKPLIIREDDPALSRVIAPDERVRYRDPVSDNWERHALIGVWVDGGFFNNIPSHVFDREEGGGETLALRLDSSRQSRPDSVTNLAEYYARLPGSLIFGTGEALATHSNENRYRAIALDTGDLTLISFSPPPAVAAAVRRKAIDYVFRYFGTSVPPDLLA